jgi:hypothetical protein
MLLRGKIVTRSVASMPKFKVYGHAGLRFELEIKKRNTLLIVVRGRVARRRGMI